MGIFDWLKKPKSNIDEFDDLIWLTKQWRWLPPYLPASVPCSSRCARCC
jgi:hypothetical protein